MRARFVLPAILILASALPLGAQTGGTPLHLAAEAGDVESIRALLDAGTPVDVGDADNSTALDVAAQMGRDAVKLLVESGADVRHHDNNGMTPLHFASYEGHDDAALYLLEHGADPAATTNRGSVALHGAALRGSAPTVAVLLEHGVPGERAERRRLHANPVGGQAGRRRDGAAPRGARGLGGRPRSGRHDPAAQRGLAQKISTWSAISSSRARASMRS